MVVEVVTAAAAAAAEVEVERALAAARWGPVAFDVTHVFMMARWNLLPRKVCWPVVVTV